MTDLSNRKPILCLDFDGVCHSYTSGWKGADVIPDPPVDGLYEFLSAASQHFEVCVFSSRSHQDGGLLAMQDWLVKHAPDGFCEWPEFVTEKPPATVSLDDRCLLFTGQWPAIDTLKKFQPWNKKEQHASSV